MALGNISNGPGFVLCELFLCEQLDKLADGSSNPGNVQSRSDRRSLTRATKEHG